MQIKVRDFFALGIFLLLIQSSTTWAYQAVLEENQGSCQLPTKFRKAPAPKQINGVYKSWGACLTDDQFAQLGSHQLFERDVTPDDFLPGKTSPSRIEWSNLESLLTRPQPGGGGSDSIIPEAPPSPVEIANKNLKDYATAHGTTVQDLLGRQIVATTNEGISDKKVEELRKAIAEAEDKQKKEAYSRWEADQKEARENMLREERDTKREREEKIKNIQNGHYSYNSSEAVAEAEPDKDCTVSKKISENSNAECAGTRTLITASQTMNMVSSVAGSMSTQILGAGAQLRASQSQTQSGALRAAASTQDTTAKMEMGVGAMNAVLGAIQFSKGLTHADISDTIKKETHAAKIQINENGLKSGDGHTANDHGYIQGTTEISKRIIENYNLNSRDGKGLTKVDVAADPQVQAAQAAKRQTELQTKQTGSAQAVRVIGQRGMNEQGSVASEAKTGALVSFAIGARQLLNGYFQKQGADQTKSAADKLEQAEQRAAAQAAAAFTPPRSDALASGDTLGARAPGAITGSGANTSPATDIQANSSPTDTTGTNGFGDSRSPENLTNTPDGAPKAGNFDTSKGGGGVAQGGGGFAPGGNTSVNDQAGKEGPTATAYNDTAGKMESGGGGRGAAYSGGGGGGGGGNPSINPADMLAQLGKLLPGGQEEGAGRKPASIEDYVNKPSGLPTALVPQNESLFDHVSTAYRSQQRKRAVGI